MNLPLIIVIGDTVKFTEPATSLYSAPTWTRTIALRQRTGAAVINAVGTTSGSGWAFTITAAQTATLTPGDVTFQDFVTAGAERYTLNAGSLRALPNVAAAAGTFDGRTPAEIDLAAVQAAMRARIAGGEVQEYTIGGRSLKKITMADLITLEGKLKADVASERRAAKAAQGLPSGRNTFIRFK